MVAVASTSTETDREYRTIENTTITKTALRKLVENDQKQILLQMLQRRNKKEAQIRNNEELFKKSLKELREL